MARSRKVESEECLDKLGLKMVWHNVDLGKSKLIWSELV